MKTLREEMWEVWQHLGDFASVGPFRTPFVFANGRADSLMTSCFLHIRRPVMKCPRGLVGAERGAECKLNEHNMLELGGGFIEEEPESGSVSSTQRYPGHLAAKARYTRTRMHVVVTVQTLGKGWKYQRNTYYESDLSSAIELAGRIEAVSKKAREDVVCIRRATTEEVGECESMINFRDEIAEKEKARRRAAGLPKQNQKGPSRFATKGLKSLDFA